MSGKYRIMYAPAALEDLETIYSYIAYSLNAEKTARNQINRIRDGIRKLDTFPEGFSSVDWEPWKSAGMRRLPIDNYIVYYLVNPDFMTVTIVRIFYGGRDVENIIKSKND